MNVEIKEHIKEVRYSIIYYKNFRYHANEQLHSGRFIGVGRIEDKISLN